MTESPPHVRAVAQVGSDRPGATGPAVLLPRRRPGYLGPVHVVQLLIAEAAVITVLAVSGRGVVVLGVAAVLGLVLLALTLTRREGRWWIERRLMTRQYRRRRKVRPVTVPADPRLTALRWLAPGLSVQTIDTRDGAQIGVAQDEAGWYAVAAVSPRAAMRDDAHDGLPLDVLVQALVDVAQPGAVLQVVTHTVPAPSLDLDPARPAGHSYRELLQRFGPVPIPVDRVTWVAVRLDARALAESGVDGVAETGRAPAAVATLIRRVAKSLRPLGFTYQVLDAGGLVDALSRSCDLTHPAQSGPAPDPREDWTAWHSGRLAHRSFWIAEWPGIAASGALLDWLSTAPAAQSSIAMILVPDGDSVDMRCVARISAPPNELAAVAEAVDRGARTAGARLFPLDGEQAPATYASAPTGGGPR
ncbi:MAG TPA: type VII secretion protein EccE [Rugosimonospora sp.]|nr:type VII secretion protein EccE [Rugosimonospora sp.]